MRILHTADLHLGQILYQYYDRVDEHAHFFKQMEKWVEEYRPDALVISGDIFDVAQPSASIWSNFTNAFVRLRRKAPEMHIVIVAGNHDSASRLQAHSEVWALASTTVIGTPPSPEAEIGTGLEKYVISLPTGFIIALPYMAASRNSLYRKLQDYVESINSERLPVVMTGHLTLSGADLQGHSFDIGNLRNVDLDNLGGKYDYLALGHIHRPQTLEYPEETWKEEQEFDPPVARYSGSPLHISCDETFPHTVSLIDMEKRGEKIRIRQLPVEQLRHFKILPVTEKAFESEKDALTELKKYIKKGTEHSYLRLRFKETVILAPDFNNKVYTLIESSGKDLRYNPRHIRVTEAKDPNPTNDPENDLRLETLTQMENPLDFIRLASSKFPDLTIEEIEDAFAEVETELTRMKEES